ncbi:MAG: DUF2059 domain-containing protein [Nitrospirota bacterium]
MKLKSFIFLIALSILCSFAKADEVSHRASAEELLLLTNTDKMLKPIWKQTETMVEQQYVQMGAPEELRPVLNKYTSKMLKVFEEEFNWVKIKDDYINIYVKTYSEEEIRAISEFYKSPAGKKFIEKMPQLTQESVKISQKLMPRLMEKIQNISKEMDNEMRQLEEQQKK